MSLEKAEECDDFLNMFETAVSKLKEHKSKAVDDEALMRAILLHAVRAKEFEHRKLEITTDLTLNVETILNRIRLHFMALRTNDHITGSAAGSKNLRFAGRAQKERDNERESILKKKGKGGEHVNRQERRIWVPPLPKDLDKVVTDKVFQRLQRWHNLCNKKNKNDWENKIVRSENYTLFSDKDRPPTPKPPSKKRTYDSDGSSGDDFKRRRSSKYNRHSSPVRKTRRLLYDEDSYSEGEQSEDAPTSDSDFASVHRHRKIAKKKNSKEKGRDRKSLKKSRSSRKTANVPHGIIMPKVSSRHGR